MARLSAVAVIGIAIFIYGYSTAVADIYRYEDENGVSHFTNIKGDTRYRLFIRTPKKTPAQYIQQYGSIINQAASRFRVDPHLVKAVIKAESDFDHQAISHKGAKGLMQLMPETADTLEVKDPFDPEENIFGGTRYLSLLLKRFKNNKRLAVAAYNAGPERVEKHNGIPPISETEAFVKRVMNFYQSFKKGSQ
ncbi:MAG: lytic transglycosylase domain-containing protein [Thermodesulfobacteriota bacterium]|nr:lytic transglycosylase domain-containing protein [Thermodesulfobacteriota bacterium]